MSSWFNLDDLWWLLSNGGGVVLLLAFVAAFAAGISAIGRKL